MALSLSSTLTMNNGLPIPVLGLGVYQARRGPETRGAVLAALRAGYRHIDTARVYGNEADVGEALRESGVPRAEVFVTTKLWNADQGYLEARRALTASLTSLGLDHVDLYLIHWPVQAKRHDSWKALAELQQEGLCRSIGVSNFGVGHLEELILRSRVVPQVNQVEMSPFLNQAALVAYCKDHGVVVEAYSPLTRGQRLAHPGLLQVARRVGRTPAQVLVRWALQKGVVVLPKSVREARIVENAAVFDFELDREAMLVLDALDEDLHTGWDPTAAP